MRVLYTSAAFDSSGYAEAARNYICALSQQPGVEVVLQTVSFENWKTNIGDEYKRILDKLQHTTVKPDVQIIHLTPENFKRFIIPGIKNIGYTVWETSKLPQTWVSMVNALDEVWVPCEWNVKVFKESGVTIPVKKIPHTFNKESFKAKTLENRFNIDDDRFAFYSIFQWSARKNPEALLQAYWHEFKKEDKVVLALKTYGYHHGQKDSDAIKEQIKMIKKLMWLKHDTAPVLLITESLSRDEILSLHARGDAFVLPHRAEGWGIPHYEAMATGNLAISSNYSGNLEFMNQKNSLLVETRETPCSGMDRPTYDGSMLWGDPSVLDLAKKMRLAYEGYKPEVDPTTVLEQFSWNEIGGLMAGRLKELA